MRQVLFVLITLAGLLAVAPVLAQPAQPDAEQLRALAELLGDPEIQSWLQAQAEGAPVVAPHGSAAAGDAATLHQIMAGRLDVMRAFLGNLAAAVPTLPGELSRAWTLLFAETQERGLFSVVALFFTRRVPTQQPGVVAAVGDASPPGG